MGLDSDWGIEIWNLNLELEYKNFKVGIQTLTGNHYFYYQIKIGYNATRSILQTTYVLRNYNIETNFSLQNEKTISSHHRGRISYIPIPLFRQLGMWNFPLKFIDLDCGMWNA